MITQVVNKPQVSWIYLKEKTNKNSKQNNKTFVDLVMLSKNATTFGKVVLIVTKQVVGSKWEIMSSALQIKWFR